MILDDFNPEQRRWVWGSLRSCSKENRMKGSPVRERVHNEVHTRSHCALLSIFQEDLLQWIDGRRQVALRREFPSTIRKQCLLMFISHTVCSSCTCIWLELTRCWDFVRSQHGTVHCFHNRTTDLLCFRLHNKSSKNRKTDEYTIKFAGHHWIYSFKRIVTTIFISFLYHVIR